MNQEDVYEDLLEVIAELTEANREAPVIVEGERDVRSLRALGLDGEIVLLNSGIPIFNLAESLSRGHSEAIILTDWDHRGGQLCRLLRDALEANGVRHDVDLRARLTLLCRKEIKDVESLAGYVERLARQSASGWRGEQSKRWYVERKGRAVQDRRARRIAGARTRARGP